MYFVRLTNIDDEKLAFLGYTLVAEDAAFKLYRDYHGDEHIVDKTNPYLYVDDPNDASLIADGGSLDVIQAPPPDHAQR